MLYDTFDIEEELMKIKMAYNRKSNKVQELLRENLKKRSSDIYSYTIDRKTFIDSINSLIKLHEWLSNAYDIGINIDECIPITNIEACLFDLLLKCCNDLDINPDIYSDISYFLYDLDGGKSWHEGCLTIDGKDINLSTVDKLWEYIEKYKLKVNDNND